MEKLSAGDILLAVHEAAEELQMKIDNKSYLLVNSESWADMAKRKEFQDPENSIEVKDDEKKVITSLESWGDAQHSNLGLSPPMPEWISSENISRSSLAWPRLSFHNAETMQLVEQESKVYESASSLSLATFASLLIEFVARLQNLVNAFQELSERANFKEPSEANAVPKEVGFWTRLRRCIG